MPVSRTQRAILSKSLKPFIASPTDTSSTAKQNKRSRTNVTVACDWCKRVRGKCDGSKPCFRCQEKRKTCTYDRAMDRRQNRGCAEATQKLEYRLVRYRRLVLTLRDSSPACADRTVRLLRSTDHRACTSTTTLSKRISVQLSQNVKGVNEDDTLATNTEKMSPLVSWVQQDLDTVLNKQECHTVQPQAHRQEANSHTTFEKTRMTLDKLLS